MARTRSRRGRPALAVALSALSGIAAAGGEPPLRDAPVVWHADDRRDIEPPQPRDPNILSTGVQASMFRPLGRMLNPVRIVRGVGSWFGGDHVRPAANVNALDEVPNSAWFTRVNSRARLRGPR